MLEIVSPFYRTARPNETIVICEREFEFQGAKPYRARGSVVLHWLPRPELLIQFDIDLMTFPFELFGHLPLTLVDVAGEYACNPSMSISLKSGPSPRRSILDCGLNSFGSVDESEPDVVLFHVVNFDGSYLETKHEGSAFGISSVDHIALSAADWKLELHTARPDRDTHTDRGTQISGFAITHYGILRSDKPSFVKSDAMDAIEGLYHFLSFANARWCLPFLCVGVKNSKFCWLHCSHLEDIEQSTFPLGGTVRETYHFAASQPVIATSFPGFMRLWNDSQWRNPLKTALSWYVEANRTRSIESALIAAQTALELVSWIHIVEQEKTLSPEGFDKLPAADRLRLLLVLQGIPTDFTKYVSDLQHYSSHRLRRWEDGPRAITELRNSIVHPKKRETVYHAPAKVRQQARRLTLWYLSSAILRLFGYKDALADI